VTTPQVSRWADGTSPTDVLIRTSLSDVEKLANGWPDIDVDDPHLPTIIA
jgi:hypothetical protein